MPATGWHEWQKIAAKTKQPYYFRPAAKPFAFAGIYAYDDRMPVLVEEDQFEGWMNLPSDAAGEMMKPYGGAIDVWLVGKDVGNVRNDRPDPMLRSS